jgi:hypothetical protein
MARLRAAGIIAAVGIALAVGTVAARRPSDFDLGWHLALGRALWTTHALPFADRLSYTFAGTRAADEFLADTALYLLVRAGGALALQLAGGLCAALLAWLLYARARPVAPPALAAGFAALAFTAAAPWLVVRPALFSFVCLAAFLLLLERERVWGLIPLQIAWSNLHGFAVLGPLLVCAFAFDAVVARRPHARRALLAVPATLAASLLSPFGLALYTNALTVGSLRGYVTEWAPVTPLFLLRDVPMVPLVALLALVGLCVRRPRPYDVLLVLLACLLGTRAARLVPLSAIVLGPLTARALAPALARARGAALLVAATGLLVATRVPATPGLRHGRGFDAANLPEGAVRFLAGARPAGHGWNFLPFGGWLSWRLPDVPLFIDGRTARVFPVPFVARYAAAEHDPAAFAALAAEWSFEWALVRARPGEHWSEPIARDPRWAMVYLDDCAAVYVRRDGPNAALAAGGYRLLRHLTAPPTGPLAPPLRDALRHDALALAQDPASPRAQALAAAARAQP